MRVAISTDGDIVSSHFGRCPLFTIINIEGGRVTKREVIDNPGHQPGFIPQFLHQRGVECIVAGVWECVLKGFLLKQASRQYLV